MTEVPAPDVVELPRWTPRLFLLLVVLLLPWIVFLSVTLPGDQTVHDYDVCWVGFDVFLLVALAAVMWLAHKRSTWIEVAAAAAGTLLLVDAWFDITTSGGAQRWDAIVSAAVIEIPVSALCWWVARNAETLRRRTAQSLLSRAAAAPN